MKKEITLKKSLLYSILIFNFYVPLFIVVVLFSNAKQSIFDGGISRGGGSVSCQSADYDPRGGGGYVCEGGLDHAYEPIRYISFSEAMTEDLGSIKSIFLLTIVMGITFGFYQFKSNKK